MVYCGQLINVWEEAMRDTVGKIATDLAKKAPDSTNPVELQKEMHKDYIDNLIECVESGKKERAEDFFIVVETKREKLLTNVLRNFFYHRHSCPTPNYDQAVYRYNRRDDKVEFLWVLPSQDASWHLLENKHLVVPAEMELLKFVLQMEDGTLGLLSKKLNGEEVESDLLIEGS